MGDYRNTDRPGHLEQTQLDSTHLRVIVCVWEVNILYSSHLSTRSILCLVVSPYLYPLKVI